MTNPAMRTRTGKQDRQYLAGLLLAAAALSIAFLIAHGLRFFLAERVTSLTLRSLTADEPNEATVKAYLAQDFNSVEQLNKSHLFAPAPPKRNPVAAVQGVMGQSALINGKWYSVGDKVKDAKIVAIESTLVTVEWKGKKSTFAPIDGGSAGPSPGGPPGRAERPARPGGQGRRAGPKVGPGPKPTAGRAKDFSPADIAGLKEMSPEERKAAMVQFMNR